MSVMRRRVPSLLLATAVLLAACSGAAPSPEAHPTPSPDVQPGDQPVDLADAVAPESSPQPEPASADGSATRSVFDFAAVSGASTWPEGDRYSELGGLRIDGWDLPLRIGQSDLVVIVDIVSVHDAKLNSSENTWWHTPVEADIMPLEIRSRVVAEVVGLVKHREGNMPGRSIIPTAPSARAPDLPSPPEVGEKITLSINGGRVTLTVPDDQWDAYIAEVNFYQNQPVDGEHTIEPEEALFDDPNPGTLTYAREPGLAVVEGHRYLLFLDGMIIRTFEGGEEFVWRPTFTYDLAQLEIDSALRAFRAPDGELVTVDQLLEAAEAAVEFDVAPTLAEYHLVSLAALLGEGA
jgi:hypothetical protein